MPVAKVLVIGGGISGSLTAVALAQRDVRVELVEIVPDWRGVGHGITIQGNALRAFAAAGLADEVIAGGFAFNTLRLRNADGSLIVELPTPRTGGPDLPATMGSLRSTLQETLREEVHGAGVKVRLGLTAERFDQSYDRVDVTFSDGSSGRYALVVGADGIRSHTRRLLGIPVSPRPSGMGIWRVVADRPAAMDCSELYYGGPRYKAGYSPISSDKCYAFVLAEPLDLASFGGRPGAAVLRERSKGYGGTWGEIRETIRDDMAVDYRWIESLLVDDPWYRGRVIVIGDAAHACPPLIAQGAAMCAEDAVVLAELVTGEAPVEEALAAFMRRRWPRVSLVVERSLLLVDWEIHPETPGADPARIMSETLAALQAPP